MPEPHRWPSPPMSALRKIYFVTSKSVDTGGRQLDAEHASATAAKLVRMSFPCRSKERDVGSQTTGAAFDMLAIGSRQQKRDVACVVRMARERRIWSIVELPEHEARHIAARLRPAVERGAQRFLPHRLSARMCQRCPFVMIPQLVRLYRRQAVSYGK